ncbi:RNA-binding protein [Lentibacillus sp. N15]|uniref:YlmH family RNA-binding protein n=1 Tax=Lentibacillus songyuanensis TaxID=3136161 RepID=UPI0031BA6451
MADIYQHFRQDEQAFIDQVLTWKERVETTYIPKLTDFLDPREQQIIEMLIGKHHDILTLHKHGGGPFTERKRIMIAPMYEMVDEADFGLALVQTNYPKKFITLEHRDVMGALLSLGIKRKKLGDIHVADGIAQILLAEEIAPYVLANLTTIKQANVTFTEEALATFLGEETHWEETEQTVSSLRLDAVLKEIYKLSRKDAAHYVGKNLVKVNHKTVENPAYQLQGGDLLSLRGKGRSKLCAINGQTKKEKWRITTAILK